jgi:hypothetical protein
MQEKPSSCWAEFGQPFSTLNGKITCCRSQSSAEPTLSRCINASRHPKATQVPIAMRGRSALLKQFPAQGGQALRDRRPTRFARQLTDQTSVHRADEPCYPFASGTWELAR